MSEPTIQDWQNRVAELCVTVGQLEADLAEERKTVERVAAATDATLREELHDAESDLQAAELIRHNADQGT